LGPAAKPDPRALGLTLGPLDPRDLGPATPPDQRALGRAVKLSYLFQ